MLLIFMHAVESVRDWSNELKQKKKKLNFVKLIKLNFLFVIHKHPYTHFVCMQKSWLEKVDYELGLYRIVDGKVRNNTKKKWAATSLNNKKTGYEKCFWCSSGQWWKLACKSCRWLSHSLVVTCTRGCFEWANKLCTWFFFLFSLMKFSFSFDLYFLLFFWFFFLFILFGKATKVKKKQMNETKEEEKNSTAERLVCYGLTVKCFK